MTRKITDEEIKQWQAALSGRLEIEERRIWKEDKRTQLSIPHSATSKPQARLDLHGLSLEKAHTKFVEFIYFSAMDNLKKLLVITGKGNPGKIRAELVHWCKADYMHGVVASCTPAPKTQGGDGAFIIKLNSRL